MSKRLHWRKLVRRGLSGDYKIDCLICGAECYLHIDRLPTSLAGHASTWFRIRCHCGDVATHVICRRRLGESDKRSAIYKLSKCISSYRRKSFANRLSGVLC